jgi:hypothetical protein
MFVVCCQVEVSVSSVSLVQRSPTDCGASLCVIKKPRGREGHAEPEGNKETYPYQVYFLNSYSC